MTIPAPSSAELETETWLPAPGWPDYLVSNMGRVMSMKNRRRPIIKATFRSERDGREVVFLHDGKQHSVLVHRLVGEAFLGPRPEHLETRHLDGDACNSRLSNLVYGTHLENEADKQRHGTHHLANRTHCPQNHPYSGANLYIIPSSGARVCRTCKRAQNAALHERRMMAAANVRPVGNAA